MIRKSYFTQWWPCGDGGHRPQYRCLARRWHGPHTFGPKVWFRELTDFLPPATLPMSAWTSILG